MTYTHDLQALIDSLSPINPSDYGSSDIRCIKDVFFDALSAHPRVLAIRCRLTVPQEHIHTRKKNSFQIQEKLLIQFIYEFKDELATDQRIKREQRRRTHGSDVFYFWRTNRNAAGNIYYDLFIMVNKDEYHKVSDYEGTDLSAMIIRAWASVIRLSAKESYEYVFFSKRYKLSSKRENFIGQLQCAFDRVCSMLQRNEPTHWSNVCHFGSSQYHLAHQ
ncbi:inovirus-type Gp2 protein [uncultured Tolumonas sp.]|uniref:YagK/YfjJ domain-containing protein n=1 Tax=uncultured Tolumonas sp. TaxID=263765 RepID=UPI002930E8AD|nr:inovirus-type Gp2 protein [uncultured Tolumonas sp.]